MPAHTQTSALKYFRLSCQHLVNGYNCTNYLVIILELFVSEINFQLLHKDVSD